jgi:hypothetical protein
MEMSIGCSHENCSKLATRQTTVELTGVRSGGERMLIWVCNEHVRQSLAKPRAGLVQRMMAAASLRIL